MKLYPYLLVMAGVTYLIRMLPMTLLRKPIRSRFIFYHFKHRTFQPSVPFLKSFLILFLAAVLCSACGFTECGDVTR